MLGRAERNKSGLAQPATQLTTVDNAAADHESALTPVILQLGAKDRCEGQSERPSGHTQTSGLTQSENWQSDNGIVADERISFDLELTQKVHMKMGELADRLEDLSQVVCEV